MRATRTAVVVTMGLLLGTMAAVTATAEDQTTVPPINQVQASMTVDQASSLGDFSVDGSIFQYRSVPMTGSELVASDPRLSGQLASTWNWDIHPSGKKPIPAWGTMRIEAPATVAGSGDGAWAGTFTGIRRADFEPFSVRAFLVGEGTYEGLCATLDIWAGDDGWLVDGVIHPLPMES